MLGVIILYFSILLILAVFLILVTLLTRSLDEMIRILWSVGKASFGIFIEMDSSSDKDGEDSGWSFKTKFLIWCVWTCFVLGLAVCEAVVNQLEIEERKMTKAYYHRLFTLCAPHIQFVILTLRQGKRIWKSPDLALLQQYFKPYIKSPYETNELTADVLLFIYHANGYRNKDLEARLKKPLKAKGIDIQELVDPNRAEVDRIINEYFAEKKKK